MTRFSSEEESLCHALRFCYPYNKNLTLKTVLS